MSWCTNCSPLDNSVLSPEYLRCSSLTAGSSRAFLRPQTLTESSVFLMSRSLQDAVASGNIGEVEVRINMGEDVNDSFPPRLVNLRAEIRDLTVLPQISDLSSRRRPGRQPGDAGVVGEERSPGEPGRQRGSHSTGISYQVRSASRGGERDSSLIFPA